MTASVERLTTAPQQLPQRHTPCLSRLTALRPWRETTAIRVGSWEIGLRAGSARGAALVAELFADVRAPELDGVLLPNFSVEIADDAGARTRGLHLVYRDHEIVARRHEVHELLLDLAELVEETRAAECSDLLAVRAAAVVLPDHGVLLLPTQWHGALLPHQARMARDGLTLLPTRTQLVDSVTAEVVTGAPERASGRLAERLPVRLWVHRIVEDYGRPVRPAEAVQLGFPAVANMGVLGSRATLDRLAGLAEKVPALGLPQLRGAALMTQLRRLTQHT